MANTHFKGPIVITGTGTSSNAGNDTIAGTLAVTGAITATGGVTGAVTGNVTGNVAGNVTGNVVGSISGGNSTNTISSIASTIVAAVPNGSFDAVSAANIELNTTNGGALSVTKLYSKISAAGAETRTLAAPSTVGQLKIIEMTVHGGDCTLSLANVVGGSAGTTATFGAVGQSLILLGLASKWVVLGNSAVLS